MPTTSPKLKMMIPNSRQLLVGLMGLGLAVFGAVYTVYSEVIFDAMLHKAMVLRPDSIIYKFWQSPPINATVEVYMYNWTNSEDFNNPNIKPKVEEVGPYRFVEVSQKVDIKWHPENSSVTYRKNNYYYFDAAASNGSLDTDRIVSINILAMGMAEIASQKFDPVRRSLVNMALTMYGYDMVMVRTPRELLFDGFQDPVMDLVSVVPSSWTSMNIPLKRFGYAHGRNGTSKFYGLLNMFTGANDISKIGQIHTWNNRTYNPAYETPNMPVVGTPGEFQPPNPKKSEPLDIFLPDICRPVTLEYDADTTVDNIDMYRYVAGMRSVDNGTLYPENEQYCNGECMPSGVMNIRNCLFGMPAVISYPHFYKADPYYAAQVEGQHPDKERHETQLLLEPRTGFTTDLRGRFQINLYVHPLPQISMFRNVRKIFMPMLWFEYRIHLTGELMDYLHLIPKALLLNYAFGVFCILAGLTMFLRLLYQFYLKQGLQQMEINVWQSVQCDNKSLGGKDGIFRGSVTQPEVSPLLTASRKLSDPMDTGRTTRAPMSLEDHLHA